MRTKIRRSLIKVFSLHWTLWYLTMLGILIVLSIEGLLIFGGILAALILLALYLIFTDKGQKNDPS